MKKKFKIFTACIALLLCALTMTLPALASEPSEDTELSEESGAVNESPAEAAPESEGASFFESVYSVATENSEEIFSFLAFVGTLIVAVIYKKGLLPGIRAASGIIGEAVKGIQEDNERISLEAKGQSELIDSLGTALDKLRGEVERLSEGLSVSKQMQEQKKLSALLDAQVDLLREVFVSSSLPQYRKEAVEARVKEMKEKLSNEELSE